MKWELPPDIKIYEALGAVADGRIEVSGNTGKCSSSSGNKSYDISYDQEQNAIMANDNGSYWKGYLGYPAIAFLMKTGVLPYREDLAALLKGVPWKDINQKFKNDFEKTRDYVLKDLAPGQKGELEQYVAEVQEKIKVLDLNMLGKRTVPPEGY